MTKLLTLKEMREYGKELAEQIAKEMQAEPVAWGVQEGLNLHDVFLFKDEADEMCHLKGDHAKAIPLYTAPPQREWQGLTDEEIEKLVYDIRSQTTGVVATAYVARAIEAKLKAKNGY